MPHFFRPRTFRLRTLLLFVAVCAMATAFANWFVRHSQYSTAVREFDRTVKMYKADTVLVRQVCEASLRVLQAELAVPYRSSQPAYEQHVQRLADFEQSFTSAPWCGGSPNFFASEEKTLRGFVAQAKSLVNGHNG